MTDISHWQTEFSGKDPETILAFFIKEFGKKIALASSLGAEDQVLTHMAVNIDPGVRIFVLDTGRLHPETYEVMAESEHKYGIRYEVQFPDREKVEAMVNEKGINCMYDSIDNRKGCCHLRKVVPLSNILSTCDAWITGLRREQAVTRTALQEVEWDEGHNIAKINPLAAWHNDDVWAYIRQHQVPYNALHDKGFPSIGCAPCTRAIEEGEDLRAGRWWWEQPESKECGLHIVDGKLVRKKET